MTNHYEPASAAAELFDEDETAERSGVYDVDRPRGRAVPPRPSRRIEIVLDDTVVGSVDPMTLTAGAQLDLEDCNRTRELIGWLVKYAGADAKRVEVLLRPMPLQAILDLASDISTALGKGIAVPKRSARR